jgi:hypothetical protein
VVETLALPALLLSTLGLIAMAVYRALAWSSMTHLVINPKDRIQAENQIFATLAQILGGGFILTGLYFTGKSYILSRRGQFAERLGAAIEGLGDTSLERRVGSILSLGAMAGGHDKDALVIARILCACVRPTTTTDQYRDMYTNRRPRADVQAAVSVLGEGQRRSSLWTWVDLDLRGSVLDATTFDKGDFRRARFQECQLRGSSFFRARLSRANFSRADTSESNFNQADLRRTSFFQCVSSSCTFRRSALLGANLTRANLASCSFDGARIVNCRFGQAELRGASFRGAEVRGGNYHRVDVEVLRALGIAPPA